MTGVQTCALPILTNKDKTDHRLVWLKGCGLYNSHGYRKPRFRMNQEPFEYLGIFGEIMNVIANMNPVELQRILMNQKFIDKNAEFTKFLVDLEKEYIKFLENIIPNKSYEEYKDLKKMIEELTSILKYRSEYFNKKMDTIVGNILEYVEEMDPALQGVTGGKMPDIIAKNSARNIQVIQQYPKQNIALSNTRRLSRSQKEHYESIKNIPLPTRTEYKLKHLVEPYRSYYASALSTESTSDKKSKSVPLPDRKNKDTRKAKSLQNNKTIDNMIVDTFNEGYCVSNEEFEKIKKRLSA
mgnify:CR=1 FL=1